MPGLPTRPFPILAGNRPNDILDFKDAVRARLTLFNDTSHYVAHGLAVPEVPAARLSNWWGG